MYYNVLNLLSVSEIAEMVSRCSEPSDEYMKKYIAEAKFTYAPVENEESYHKYETLRGWDSSYKLCHFIKDGKKVNDKMYGLNCELNEWYQRTLGFTKVSRLYDFFFRYEISHYTKEECNTFNKDRKKYHYSEPARKVGQEYLKKTCVIIDLQTGEESPIEIPEFRRGYIVYDKYYRPESERAIYDVKTGKLVLKHGYNHEVESDNYVFFDAERNYNEPKKVLMLNKETGEVKEWL